MRPGHFVTRFLLCLLCLIWPVVLFAQEPGTAPATLNLDQLRSTLSGMATAPSGAPGQLQPAAAVDGQQTPSARQENPAEGGSQPLPPAEKSQAEAFFARPAPAIGQAVRGEAPAVESGAEATGQAARRGTAREVRSDLQVPVVDRDLKQFGYDFFEARGSGGFQPDRLAPVGPDYVIGPGDTLEINIWGSIDASHEVTVDRSGDILLPKVGTIHLWGLAFSQAKQTIRQRIAKYYKDFQLNVSMGALRSIQVFVVGEVRAPGTYTVSSLATMLNALVAAGGPAKTGSLREVRLVRNGQVVARTDFYDFFLDGDRSQDARLQSGDTVLVPIVGPLVGVAGDVRRPAIYELKGQESLPEVLKMAGGVVASAYLKRVQVERVEAHHKTVALDVDLSRLNQENSEAGIALQDRDLVMVAPIAPSSSTYVSLTGYVARPGHYQLVSGMRLTDLLTPYDNLLPDFYPGLAQVLRLVPPDYQPQQLTVDLGQALAGDPQQNIELQKFDEVRIFSRDQMQDQPTITVSGAVLRPGSYRYYGNMTVRDLIVTAGNVKRSAYLTEAELTRFIPDGQGTRTERMLLNLQQALQGDPVQNLLLEPEDHLFVRAIPDYAQEHLVKVSGRVLFPGTYAVAKGERLSSVLARAGGFAEGAYLRGAVFSRQALKEVQRQRLQKLIVEQEQEIARTAADIAQGALSSEELQSAKTLMESRQILVKKLREASVAGRMVVHLAPLPEFTGSEYDIEVQGGDTLVVPENPKSVSVLGQVYNPVALSYRSGKTAAYYLARVGGPKENANSDEMFIVRADGTVLSKSQGGKGLHWDSGGHRWVSGGFDGTEMYPGDALLVPEKVTQPNVMREVKDITTILYQMALGAAAVASF